jgi:hypothetical protein
VKSKGAGGTRFSSSQAQTTSIGEPAHTSSRILVETMSSEHNNPRNPIRIGSRGSQLALWQANHILYALRDAGYHVELEIIRTTGDRM